MRTFACVLFLLLSCSCVSHSNPGIEVSSNHVYHMEELNPADIVDTSSNGEKLLYKANLTGGGDFLSGDFVIADLPSNDIWFLSHYRFPDQAIFCGDQSVLINRIDELKLLNVYTGDPLPNTPRFDYGELQTEVGIPQYYTLGIAFDENQSKTLIAYRETYDESIYWEETSIVSIAVFNIDGHQVNTINTGFMIQPYIRSFINRIEFEIHEDGTAVLSTLISKNLDDPIEKMVLGEINYY